MNISVLSDMTSCNLVDTFFGNFDNYLPQRHMPLDSKVCSFLGFRSRIAEASALKGYETTLMGNQFPKF
jgi:hypothetical protein